MLKKIPAKGNQVLSCTITKPRRNWQRANPGGVIYKSGRAVMIGNRYWPQVRRSLIDEIGEAERRAINLLDEVVTVEEGIDADQKGPRGYSLVWAEYRIDVRKLENILPKWKEDGALDQKIFEVLGGKVGLSYYTTGMVSQSYLDKQFLKRLDAHMEKYLAEVLDRHIFGKKWFIQEESK